ncbi:o-succinylbenzoate--CoA ligase [Shewanella sp. GXUN23E]|uniref:o-succinylbenzoate--CoA ligase n=1 Tax=Shewanella sp. GXUN23E TaxID=3422498 RepID=UPI003D7CB59D
MTWTLSPLHQAAVDAPQAIAVCAAGQQLSYQQLSQRVLALATSLSNQGLGRGDVLGVISSNRLEMLMLYWACLDIGALFCPVSPKFPPAQITTLLKRCGARYYWSDAGLPGSGSNAGPEQALTANPLNTASLTPLTLDFNAVATQTPAMLDDTQAANIIFTSGSSGMPKAAVHNLAQHMASAVGSASLIALTEGDRWLASLPLFHIGGLAILNRCAAARACVVFADAGQPLAQQLLSHQITHLSLVATQLQRLLQQAQDSLKYIKALLLGGGAIAQPLLDKLDTLGIHAFTSYGMTEMASQITTGKALGDGSSGKLLPGRELILRDGVIWVRGATLFMGYLSDTGLERQTDSQGWFCTKDRGYWDDAGHLHICGRSDNMFVCGGENLQPEEVEAVLKQLPGVEDALVFALADEEFGCLPAAIIKGQIPSQVQADEFICRHIARFKRPRAYFSWPAGVAQTGLKINRRQLIDAVRRNEGLLPGKEKG